MSRLIRSPKSASDWSDNELEAYRIVVKEQSATVFFGGELPEPNCPQGLLHNLTVVPNMDRAARRALWNLEETRLQFRQAEASVDQFASALLEAAGFTGWRVNSSVRRPLQLLIGGERRSAQTDMCLLYDHTVLLLVQEDKVWDRSAECAEQ